MLAWFYGTDTYTRPPHVVVDKLILLTICLFQDSCWLHDPPGTGRSSDGDLWAAAATCSMWLTSAVTGWRPELHDGYCSCINVSVSTLLLLTWLWRYLPLSWWIALIFCRRIVYIVCTWCVRDSTVQTLIHDHPTWRWTNSYCWHYAYFRNHVDYMTCQALGD